MTFESLHFGISGIAGTAEFFFVTLCRCSQHRVEWGRLGSNGVETGGRGTIG
jgi:hypothetical protein